MGSGPRGIPHVFRLVAAKPAFVLVVVSVAVMVWLPVAARVTWNTRAPWSAAVNV